MRAEHRVLDVFRGLAAALMVVNHAGVAWLAPAGTTSGAVDLGVTLGSFAPVLFFFATGFALGLPGQAERGLTLDRLWKCGLLFIADQFFFWSVGAPAGLDFFSFIALSMLVLYTVGSARHATAVALGLAALTLVARFGFGPLLDDRIPETGLLAFLTGVSPQPGISYPLAPWLAYPLLGLVCARWRGRAGSSRQQTFVLLTLAAACLGVASFMHAQGISFHRWSSVAAGFFVASLAVLATSWWLCGQAERLAPNLSRRLGMRGVSAFLVVPIHYAFVELGVHAGLAEVSEPVFIAGCAALLMVSFFASRRGTAVAESIAGSGRAGGLVLLATLPVIAAASFAAADQWPLPAFGLATLGQLIAAAMLARRKARVARQTVSPA